MIFLLFNSEEKAQQACEQVWANIIISAEPERIVVEDGKAKLKSINSKGEYIDSYTEKYAEPKKIYEKEQWFILKPANDYMNGVEFDSASEFQMEWLAPPEEIEDGINENSDNI